MTPREHDDCTDFLVYPFRRQLVDETAMADETLVRMTRPTAAPAPVPPPVRRRGHGAPSPLRLALPLAASVFVLAAGGAAFLSTRGGPAELAATPAAAAATPVAAQPRRHRVARPQPLFVPDVGGLKQQAALRTLRRRHFRPVLATRPGRAGVVVGQQPAAATRVARPGRVVVYVGVHPKPRPVVAPAPAAVAVVASVVGLDKHAAANALLAEGYGVTIYGVHSSQPLDRVVAQSPRPGARLRAGAYVRINVSAG